MNILKKIFVVSATLISLAPALAMAQASGCEGLMSGDQCVPCPQGQVVSGDQCVVPPVPTCPDGQVLSGDQCVAQPVEPPVAEAVKVNYKVMGTVLTATKDDVTVELSYWSKGTITDEAVQSWPDSDSDGKYELTTKVMYDEVTKGIVTVVRQEGKLTPPEQLKVGAPVVVSGYYMEVGEATMFYAVKVLVGAKKMTFTATVDDLVPAELGVKVTFVRPPKALKGNKGMTFHVSQDTKIKSGTKGAKYTDLKGKTIKVTGYPVFDDKGLLADVLAKTIVIQKVAPGKNIKKGIQERNK